MNGGGGSGVVEALSGAAGVGTRPLATLQALAEALGALGAANAHAADPATPVLEAAQADAPVLPDAVLPSSHALAAQSAQQGQMTLGQLAAEQAQRQASVADAPPSASNIGPTQALLRQELPAEAAAAPRLHDVLAVPVAVSALHTPFAGAVRAGQPEEPPRTRWSREGDGHRHEAEPEEPEAMPAERQAAQDEAPDDRPDPEAARLRAALERAGRNDALLELDRGRRVLLVLPQDGTAPVPAVAWLVGPRRAQRHVARWWPGLAGIEGWLPWRVFRDGDPQLGRGLLSRAAGTLCRVRLGPQPPRLPDAGAANLEIAERIRFAQGLGGQWSLLLLAAPAGWTP